MINTFKKLIAVVVGIISVSIVLAWVGWPAVVITVFEPSPMWVFVCLAVLWTLFWSLHLMTGPETKVKWIDALFEWAFQYD